MTATWDCNQIESMSQEAKARNVCRQLRQEAIEWKRSFYFQGKPVRRSQYLPTGVSLLIGGYAGRQWVQVEYNGTAVTGKINPANASEVYVAIMEAADKSTYQS